MNNNVIIESFSNRKSVKIKYYSETTDGRTKERVIDVYGYNNRYFGGYCHLRKDMRTFRFDRIVEARPTSEEYTIDLLRLKKLQEAGYITQQDTVKPPLKIKASESLKTKINSSQALKDDLDNTNIIQYEAKGPLANLVNYYISCINEEDNKSLKLRIDGSSRNILINFIDKELLISQNKDSIILNNSTRRVIDFFTPSLIDGKEGNVYYGYPIVVNPVGDISPLFYTEINIVKTNDSLKIVRQSQEVYLNQIFFNRDLDLSDEEAKIVIEDIENYFNLHTEFQEKINYIIELLNYDKTFINPELLIPFTKPPDISTSIVNQAIIYTGEVNPITSGLLKELNLLKTKPYYENVEKTCVNFLINSIEQQHSIIKNENSERDIITILQSNGSQLSVLKSALSNSLTVVTGPPGTGKSQVVVNILANIALKGYSVLFASKNNKAVEVVLEKLSRNLGSDIAVRTGSWEYRKQATEYLKSFNRSGFSYSEFESSKIAVIKAKEQYLQKYNNYKKVQGLRNKIEQLQAILDGTFPAQKKEEISFPH